MQNLENVMLSILGNSLEPLSEQLIGIFDQSVFCMTSPRSLWFEKFCRVLKVCTVHRLLT